MKAWQRRLLGILDLGGGFLGAVLILNLLLRPLTPLVPTTFWSRIFALPFLGLYCWGIWCGVRTLENEGAAIRANLWYWGIQIPCFMSSLVGYLFASGALLVIAFTPRTARTEFMIKIGSQFQYSIAEGKQFQVGINCFALVVYLLLLAYARARSRRELAIGTPAPP